MQHATCHDHPGAGTQFEAMPDIADPLKSRDLCGWIDVSLKPPA